MDDPALDPNEHRQALEGLSRLNAVSMSVPVLWTAIRNLCTDGRLASLKVLDIASGGGDVALRLAVCARRHGIDLNIAACDMSPTALALTAARAEAAGIDARCFRLDALSDELPGNYDVVMNSLFMHHLDESEGVLLLRKMKQAAVRMVLVNDLERSRLNWWLVWLACHTLTRSRIVHFDGPVSVRAAYTVPELRRLAIDAGLDRATVERRFPCRMLLTWRRPDEP